MGTFKLDPWSLRASLATFLFCYSGGVWDGWPSPTLAHTSGRRARLAPGLLPEHLPTKTRDLGPVSNIKLVIMFLLGTYLQTCFDVFFLIIRMMSAEDQRSLTGVPQAAGQVQDAPECFAKWSKKWAQVQQAGRPAP